jgi:hypothetical protein
MARSTVQFSPRRTKIMATNGIVSFVEKVPVHTHAKHEASLHFILWAFKGCKQQNYNTIKWYITDELKRIW